MTDVLCDTTPENMRRNFCFERDVSLKVVLGVRRLHIYLAMLQISFKMSFLGLPLAPVTLNFLKASVTVEHAPVQLLTFL